jgi:NAD(P)-dependent dehydrogenase (short-subunit alcohol dehydrogenase family)
MSSGLSSLTHRWGNPVILPIYRSTKAALNILILHYTLKYRDYGWKINANCLGYFATDMNAFAGFNTPDSGALNAVSLVTLGEEGETGTFSNKEGLISWQMMKRQASWRGLLAQYYLR